MAELVWRFALLLAVGVLVIPLFGGASLRGAFAVARIHHLSFRMCWKAYFTACCLAYVLLMGVELVLRNDPAIPYVRMAVFMAATVPAVPLLLRDYSRRALVVGGVAVLLIDVLLVGLFVLFYQTMEREDPPGRQTPPAGRSQISSLGEGEPILWSKAFVGGLGTDPWGSLPRTTCASVC